MRRCLFFLAIALGFQSTAMSEIEEVPSATAKPEEAVDVKPQDLPTEVPLEKPAESKSVSTDTASAPLEESTGALPTDTVQATPQEEPLIQLHLEQKTAPPIILQTDPLDGIAVESSLMSVNYPQEEIRKILRNVADIYDLNVVIPEDLTGKTSLKLKNVSWRQVFDIILKPLRFTYTEENGIIYITSLESLKREPMVMRTFPIKYAKATEIAAALAPILEKNGGTIEVDKRTNSLLVRDRPSALEQIKGLLDPESSPLDRPATQVMIETKFIEVSKTMGSDDDGLGFDWWRGGALFGNTNNLLNVTGQVDFFQNYKGSSFPGSRFRAALLSDQTYRMVLQALETSSSINLVANPTLVTLNNEKATFHVGRKQPIIQANFDNLTGSYTIGTVDYLPVGVELEITPRINAGAEQITLHIKPKVSRIVGTVDFGTTTEGSGGIISYPIEAVRETDTIVNIKNGYTLALGGLIQDDEIEVIKKIPLLGDIPKIGRIFRNHSKEKEKINLIIFITARTLNPDGGTFEEVVDPRLMAKMGVSDEMIPGFSHTEPMPGMLRMTPEERKLLKKVRQCKAATAVENQVTCWANELNELCDPCPEKKPKRRGRSRSRAWRKAEACSQTKG